MSNPWPQRQSQMDASDMRRAEVQWAWWPRKNVFQVRGWDGGLELVLKLVGGRRSIRLSLLWSFTIQPHIRCWIQCLINMSEGRIITLRPQQEVTRKHCSGTSSVLLGSAVPIWTCPTVHADPSLREVKQPGFLGTESRRDEKCPSTTTRI